MLPRNMTSSPYNESLSLCQASDCFLITRERSGLNVRRSGSMIDKDRLRYRIFNIASNEATDDQRKERLVGIMALETMIETMIMPQRYKTEGWRKRLKTTTTKVGWRAEKCKPAVAKRKYMFHPRKSVAGKKTPTKKKGIQKRKYTEHHLHRCCPPNRVLGSFRLPMLRNGT